MKTVIDIIRKHGGKPTFAENLAHLQQKYLKIYNEPWMSLTIEYTGDSILSEGDKQVPEICVSHYGKQNGDAMRDPEMCFAVHIRKTHDGKEEVTLTPTYFRNDYMGLEQFVYERNANGQLLVRPKLAKSLQSFTRTWNKNLREQGFDKAFSEAHKKGTASPVDTKRKSDILEAAVEGQKIEYPAQLSQYFHQAERAGHAAMVLHGYAATAVIRLDGKTLAGRSVLDRTSDEENFAASVAVIHGDMDVDGLKGKASSVEFRSFDHIGIFDEMAVYNHGAGTAAEKAYYASFIDAEKLKTLTPDNVRSFNRWSDFSGIVPGWARTREEDGVSRKYDYTQIETGAQLDAYLAQRKSEGCRAVLLHGEKCTTFIPLEQIGVSGSARDSRELTLHPFTAADDGSVTWDIGAEGARVLEYVADYNVNASDERIYATPVDAAFLRTTLAEAKALKTASQLDKWWSYQFAEKVHATNCWRKFAEALEPGVDHLKEGDEITVAGMKLAYTPIASRNGSEYELLHRDESTGRMFDIRHRSGKFYLAEYMPVNEFTREGRERAEPRRIPEFDWELAKRSPKAAYIALEEQAALLKAASGEDWGYSAQVMPFELKPRKEFDSIAACCDAIRDHIERDAWYAGETIDNGVRTSDRAGVSVKR